MEQIYRIHSIFQVGIAYYLRVTGRSKRVTLLLEFLTQPGMIIDFSILIGTLFPPVISVPLVLLRGSCIRRHPENGRTACC